MEHQCLAGETCGGHRRQRGRKHLLTSNLSAGSSPRTHTHTTVDRDTDRCAVLCHQRVGLRVVVSSDILWLPEREKNVSLQHSAFMPGAHRQHGSVAALPASLKDHSRNPMTQPAALPAAREAT